MWDLIIILSKHISLNLYLNIYRVFLFHFTAPTCDGPLVGGANPIPDVHMTASSYLIGVTGIHFLPSNARLNGTSAWCPSTAEIDAPIPTMYIQVSLSAFNFRGRCSCGS